MNELDDLTDRRNRLLLERAFARQNRRMGAAGMRRGVRAKRRPLVAEALDAIAGLAPYARWRADSGKTVDEIDGTLIAWRDMTDTFTITASASNKQPGVLAAVSEANDQEGIAFRADSMRDNASPEDWRFGHNGNGFELITVWVLRGTNNGQTLVGTGANTVASLGVQLKYDGGLDRIEHKVFGDVGQFFTVTSSETVGAPTQDTLQKMILSHGEARTPNWGVYRNGAEIGSGSYTAQRTDADGAGVAVGSLATSDSSAAHSDCLEVVFFDRTLSGEERASVITALEERYG